MIMRPTGFHSSASIVVRLALVGVFLAPPPRMTAQQIHDEHAAAPARLVQLVRDATRPFVDVNAATAAGYGPFLGCVSGPDHGAMGVHYVNGALVADGKVSASEPELVVYEPLKNGGQRLVAAEYVVFQAAWDAQHDEAPSLFGREFELVKAGNRYGLPAFYELHAWLWKHNPSGFFEDWNPRVTCANA